jgi:hypothetical protein
LKIENGKWKKQKEHKDDATRSHSFSILLFQFSIAGSV